MRKGQGQLDLVRHSLGVASALERNAEGGGASPESRASKAERAHLAMDGREKVVMVSLCEPGLRCKGRSSDAGCSLAARPVTWVDTDLQSTWATTMSQLPTDLCQTASAGMRNDSWGCIVHSIDS